MTGQPDRPTLLIDGRRYAGWTEINVSRSLKQAAASFDLRVTERWAGMTESWPILPFAEAEIWFDDDRVVTGYVDRLTTSLGHGKADVRISGRSKTADLVDCTPEIGGTEFRRSTLPAICRALATPFGIEVWEEIEPGAPFALEAFERGDRAWETIERLCRMRGVLATDDPAGRLVLTRAGNDRAVGRLVQGENVESATLRLDGSKRFSRYIVLAQQPGAAATDIGGDGDPEDEDPAQRPGTGDQPAIIGTAEDPGVPRFRPRVIRAEGNGTAGDAHARALWAAATARGEALSLTVQVPGWRQPDGALWQVNQIVDCDMPRMQLQDELLVVGVEFRMTAAGRSTELDLCPPEAMKPEPIAGSGRRPGDWDDVILGSGRPRPIR